MSTLVTKRGCRKLGHVRAREANAFPLNAVTKPLAANCVPSDAMNDRKGWSDQDLALAALFTAALIAAAPFFWNPPLWVLTLMSRAPRGVEGSSAPENSTSTSGIVSKGPGDTPVANDNMRSTVQPEKDAA